MEMINKFEEYSSSYEIDLFKAMVETTFDYFDEAIQILKSITKTSDYGSLNKKFQIEIEYFLCFLYRKTESTFEGIKFANRLIIEHNITDARILREMGVLIWQSISIEDEDVADKIKGLISTEPTHKLAIEYFRKALDNVEADDFLLRIQCLNSLAYTHAETNDPDEIMKGYDYLNSLESISKQTIYGEKFNWLPRFYDTKGYVYYMMCRTQSAFSKQTKIDYLKQAIENFELALELGGLIGKELSFVKQHHFQASKYFNKVYFWDY